MAISLLVHYINLYSLRRIALLEVNCHNWLTHMLLACPTIQVGVPELNDFPTLKLNPYALALQANPQTIVVTADYYRWLCSFHESLIEPLFKQLRKSCEKIVCLDGVDTFQLGLPASGFNYFDLVLKGQGVYKDRDYYNYVLGSASSRNNWHNKTDLIKESYRSQQLEKIQLSLPCFAGVINGIRSSVRRSLPQISNRQALLRKVGDYIFSAETKLLVNRISPIKDVHFVGALTHYNRLKMLRELKEHQIDGTYGITSVPEYIWGYQGNNTKLSSLERNNLQQQIDQDGLWVKRLGRPQYKRSMLHHKVVLSPNGYGELAFRHAEAWEMKRVLVAQDISHIDTLFPFRDNGNVVFCEPDFSNLAQKIKGVISDEKLYSKIAESGYKNWKAWSGQYGQLLEEGISCYL